jgi:DNA-binding response OmpR family regulator
MHEPPRLLVIDDDEGTVQTFARALAMAGYDVRIALNPRVALHEIDACSPDAILCDLRLPFIDGLGVLYRLRANPAHTLTPVAIITGDVMADDATLADVRALGAELRFKPMWIDDVVALAALLIARAERDQPVPASEPPPLHNLSTLDGRQRPQ